MLGHRKLANLVLLVLLASTPSLADDLGESSTILCTAVQATACSLEGECVTAAPWTLNIPQFIEVDLKKKELRTTKASGENRSTPIKNIERDGDLIFLQGVEGGRAFSFVIREDTGMVSIAVARDGPNVGVFGACTPIDSSR